MLEIKDNVDLKELEKYGFKRVRYINDCSDENWKHIALIQDLDGNIRQKTDKDVFPENEVNWVSWEKDYMMIIEFDKTEDAYYKKREIIPEEIDGDILYDLIKADLVEKIGE